MKEGLEKLDAYLSRYDKFIISTHESPDWDGLGAEIAFNEFLQHLGKTSIILNSDPTPDTFLVLDSERVIQIFSGVDSLPDDLSDYAQFVLDTNDYDNIGSAYDALKDIVRDIFIVDHHEGPADLYDTHFIKAEASSASEIIYEIIEAYSAPISLKAAQAIFAGIVFDTGSFVYPKTSPYTFKIAAHLTKLGVVPFYIHELIYEQNALSSFALRSRILSTMEVLHDGRLIAMKLQPEMITETGALFTEGEMAINLPLSVKGVIASILVKQDIGGPIKVSMRTKGDYDVAKVAMDNGGGGHKNAAGYKSKISFEETYQNAIKNLEHFFVDGDK